MIVADTGGILALLDRDDRYHKKVKRFFEGKSQVWTIPWATLPEIDYLANKKLGSAVAKAFLQDVQDGHFLVDFQVTRDLPRALVLLDRFADLRPGLVDAVVIAQAERHKAEVIVTTDERHFRPMCQSTKLPARLVPIDS